MRFSDPRGRYLRPRKNALTHPEALFIGGACGGAVRVAVGPMLGSIALATSNLWESQEMSAEIIVERLFGLLVAGDRPGARRVVAEQLNTGASPEQVLTEVYWPVYELLNELSRSDKISQLAHHTAVRLLRVLVDSTSARMLESAPQNGRSVFACCAEDEQGELGAQMAVDLLESSGFRVTFAGGGVPTDEIQAAVQERRPDVLLMFCSSPSNLPDIRRLIDDLHDIGSCPHTQIAVGGGVFNRAEGLAEEIGADVWAEDPLELVDVLVHEPQQRAPEDQRTVGRGKTTPARRQAA